jgi:hypothetical protein
MLFTKLEFIPFIILSLAIIFIGALTIIISNLYSKDALKKWGSYLMAIFNSNIVFKTALLGSTIIAFILYLLFKNQILLLIFATGLGLIFGLSVNAVLLSLIKKTLEKENNQLRTSLYSLTTVSLISFMGVIVIGLYYFLSQSFKIEAVNLYYGLVTFALSYVTAAFYAQTNQQEKIVKNTLLTSSIFTASLTIALIQASLVYKNSKEHLLFTLMFVALSLLGMLASNIISLVVQKNKTIENKSDYLKMVNFATAIVLGVIFLPISYLYFKDYTPIRLGGFDLGFIVLLALIIQLGLSSTLDSLVGKKNTNLYFSILSLLIGGALLVYLNYVLPNYGFSFGVLCIITFEAFMKWMFVKEEANDVSLNLSGLLFAVNIIFVMISLFTTHISNILNQSISINNIVPFIVGICLAYFINTNHKEHTKTLNWIFTYLIMSAAVIILINTVFGFNGVLSLVLAYCLITIMANEIESTLQNRLYLALIFSLIGTVLIEVIYFFNLGIGVY